MNISVEIVKALENAQAALSIRRRVSNAENPAAEAKRLADQYGEQYVTAALQCAPDELPEGNAGAEVWHRH